MCLRGFDRGWMTMVSTSTELAWVVARDAVQGRVSRPEEAGPDRTGREGGSDQLGANREREKRREETR